MNKTNGAGFNVQQLARLIESDLRNSGLSVGNPYLTADELGRRFSVHPRSVSRAMHLLAHRGLVVRKRGVGTFVGPKVANASLTSTPTIHFLVSAERMRMGISTGSLVDGMLEAELSNQVQLDLLPDAGPAQYVRRLIESHGNDSSPMALVLVGCRREIQEAVLESRVPAVVFGGVFPSTAELPSLDVDQSELGYHLARYLIDRGRDRTALVTWENWLPGDNLYHDGIRRARDESPVLRAGMVLRSISPGDKELAVEAIVPLLQGSDRSDGLICRGPFFADAALAAAEKVGLKVPDDVEIVFDDSERRSEIRLPHAYPVQSFQEQARLVGRMLAEVMAGKVQETRHQRLPVRAVEQN